MKKLFMMLPVVLAALPACMLADLTKPNSAADATSKEIDIFLKDAVQANTLVERASMHLLKAVAAKEAVAAIEAKMMAAKAIQDPEERQAKVDAVHADLRTTLGKVDFDKENEKVKAEQNAAKNEAIRSAVWDLALAALKDVELVNSGERLASGTLSLEVIGKIPAVIEAIRRLISQGEGVAKILGRARSLISTVGLESLPTSAGEQPRVASLDPS